MTTSSFTFISLGAFTYRLASMDKELVTLDIHSTTSDRLAYRVGQRTKKSWPIPVSDPAALTFLDKNGKEVLARLVFNRSQGVQYDKKGKRKIQGLRLFKIPYELKIPAGWDYYYPGMFDPEKPYFVYAKDKLVKCPRCNGKGVIHTEGNLRDCGLCGGSGKVLEHAI